MRRVWLLAAAACGRIGFDPQGFGGGGDGGPGADGTTGDAPPMLSCSSLAATCGPSGTSPCCGSTMVPGGMFLRGYDVGTDGAFADMSNPATVSSFRLDTYEVTVGRFRQFVDAGMGTQQRPPPAGAGARTLNGKANQGGWDPVWSASLTADTAALVAAVSCNSRSWTDAPGANEAFPMNCITWYEAFAFCIWDGGFLPTEAEWNYAAAGGGEQRAFPWSSPPSSVTIDCSYANYTLATVPCASPLLVNRVGSESPKGDGKWGHADLAGNLWEWTLDGYNNYPKPCQDCAELATTSYRAVRGGAYIDDASYVRGAMRLMGQSDFHYGGFGVRCARP